jgi:hypothetical protein
LPFERLADRSKTRSLHHGAKPAFGGARRSLAAQLGKPPRLELLNLVAKYTKLSCAPASSPLNWRTRMRIPIILAFVALALSGCNANQAINPSGQAGYCAGDPTCNPYNPSSYAQNNVGIGR